MSEMTYDSLKNNIADERTDGGTMHVTFKCPACDKSFEAKATMGRATGVAANVQSEVKRQASYGIRRAIADFLRRLFGGGRAGSAASSVAYRSVPSSSGAVYGKKEKQEAVVKAFKTIERDFDWNEEQSAYIHKGE